MCGIAGGWWPQPASAQIQLPQALHAMRYRGPDDQGFELYPFNPAVVALGQVRLSIIDLSAAGHQPMHSRDGRWAIVFNGEIYNYRELRTELEQMGHRFVSDSDTEVLLAAWPCCAIFLECSNFFKYFTVIELSVGKMASDQWVFLYPCEIFSIYCFIGILLG